MSMLSSIKANRIIVLLVLFLSSIIFSCNKEESSASKSSIVRSAKVRLTTSMYCSPTNYPYPEQSSVTTTTISGTEDEIKLAISKLNYSTKSTSSTGQVNVYCTQTQTAEEYN